MSYSLKETGHAREWGVHSLHLMIGLGVSLTIAGYSLSTGSPSLLLGVCVMMGAGLTIIGLAAWVLIAALVVGVPQLHVSTPSPHPGEPFHLLHSQVIRRGAIISDISLSLIFRETVSFGEGEDTKTLRDEKIMWTSHASRGRHKAGKLFKREFSVSIPAEGMPTFSAPHHKLQWFIKVATRLPGWSDYATEYELIVSPDVPLGLIPEHEEATVENAPASVRLLMEQGARAGTVQGSEQGILAGLVEVTPTDDLYCHLWLRVGWHTEGRGDEDSEYVCDRYLYQGELSSGEPVTFPFQVQLPSEPASYIGQFVRIVWTASVEIHIPTSEPAHTNYRFILGPSVFLGGEIAT